MDAALRWGQGWGVNNRREDKTVEEKRVRCSRWKLEISSCALVALSRTRDEHNHRRWGWERRGARRIATLVREMVGWSRLSSQSSGTRSERLLSPLCDLYSSSHSIFLVATRPCGALVADDGTEDLAALASSRLLQPRLV